MKSLLMVMALVFSTAAFAEYVEQGEACSSEGQRAYVYNGEDQDVFVCENGKWNFLYKRMPNEQD